MKPRMGQHILPDLFVAPRAGAWIETTSTASASVWCMVAPRAGAWIETSIVHPLGLAADVAPRAGAWIETYCRAGIYTRCSCRPPRGGVD